MTKPRRADGEVGVAILGTSGVARRHFIPAIAKTAGVRAVGVLSRDLARAKAFAGETGIPEAYDDLGAILANPNVHAVIVTSQDGLHEAHVIAAAEAGVHVLCEKPMTTTADSAHRMAQAISRAGVTFAMGHTWRFLNGVRLMREVVRSGQLGEIRFARVLVSSNTLAAAQQWRTDPSLARSWIMGRAGTHVVDLYRWYFGEPIGVHAVRTSPRSPAANDEFALVVFTFPGGVVAEFVVSVVFPADNSLEVYGDAGSVMSRDNPFRHPPEPSSYLLNGVPVPYAPADAFAAEVGDFATAVRTGQPPASGLEDGVRNMEIMERVFQCSR